MQTSVYQHYFIQFYQFLTQLSKSSKSFESKPSMNIKEALLKEHSKTNTLKISNYIGSDAQLFAELMDCFLDDEWRLNQRAAWVVSHCADTYNDLILPHLEAMILNLDKEVHVAVKRNTLRVLQNVAIPEDLLGRLTNICFDALNSSETPVAIKVYAMTILANVCKIEPDLKQELYLVIEGQMPYGSPAFKSRGRRILKQLA